MATRQTVDLEFGVPVLLASGALYTMLTIRTTAEVGFEGGACSAEDDPRRAELTLLPVELPSGERLTLSTSLPLGAFGRVPLVRQQALPVLLPKTRQEPQPIIVTVPAPVVNINVELPGDRKTTFDRDSQGRLKSATTTEAA